MGWEKSHPFFIFLFMSIQEAISTVYKLRNEAYEQLDKLDHPDFHYWSEEKIKYQERFKCYDKCLEILTKLNNE